MTYNYFKKSLIGISAFCMLVPALVFAGADSGFYVGAGVGDAPVKVIDFDESNFDESDFSFKIFGGYNFGYVPLVDLAVEASYVDFGNPSTKNSELDVSGFNAFGLAGLSFGPFGVFAKVGLVNWDANFRIDNIGSSTDGLDPAYGIGARFQFGSLAVRAEYELYDIDSVSDISMLSASLVYTF